MKRASVPLILILVTLLLVFRAPSAFADCETPMPAVVPIDQAAANPQQSAFLGIWNGTVQGSWWPSGLREDRGPAR